jgi:hypothetical protein
MTSPKFINWLARGPRNHPKGTPAHFARLAVIYNESDDPEFKKELAAYMNAVNEEQQ